MINDLKRAIKKIAPSNIPYEHDKRWGDGNGFSHMRVALMMPLISIPVTGGRLSLGTWQQIVFIDFDNRARQRALMVQVTGETRVIRSRVQVCCLDRKIRSCRICMRPGAEDEAITVVRVMRKLRRKRPADLRFCLQGEGLGQERHDTLERPGRSGREEFSGQRTLSD